MSLSFLHSPFFVSFFGSSRILGDAKSYVGDRCRIKVKKYLSFLYPYACSAVLILWYPPNQPVSIGHLAWFARPSIRFSFSLANGVPMDARYLLHAGNRKALGKQ